VAGNAYLVERYWPGVSTDKHRDALARSRRTAREMQLEGKRIEHVRSTLVPEQETVLCIFEAESKEIVAELNDRADFRYDRIVAAVAVPTGPEDKQ
jgi:Protein of unknown function (DUF4242)